MCGANRGITVRDGNRPLREKMTMKLTQVNGHAALPGLEICPVAGRPSEVRRELRRRARQVRAASLEERKRRRLTPPTAIQADPSTALKLVATRIDLEPPAGSVAGRVRPTEGSAPRKRLPAVPAPVVPATPERNPGPKPAKPPRATRKAPGGPPRPPVPGHAEQAAGAGGKGTPGGKGRSHAPANTKGGTKKETVLALLRRPQGATLAELREATGWQSHSVRGFLSGALRKKMALKVRSGQRDGVRVYSVRG